MSRTFVKGRKNFKRIDCGKGHLNCSWCGFDSKYDQEQKTKRKKIMTFEIIPYIYLIKNRNYYD